MGISRLTVLAIQANDVEIEVFSNKEKTKYGYLISSNANGHYHMHISIEPHYSSNDESETAGHDLVKKIKELDAWA